MADVEKNGSAVEAEEAATVDDSTKEIAEKKEAAKEEVAAAAAKSATEAPSTLERKIIKQIEYYFGDANLARDKFLTEEIGKDEGWVSLATLLTFKRLSSLSDDATVIAAALDKSDEGLVEISEDRTKIRRHPERPLPEQNEETRKEVISRTAFVKGFPQDTEMSALLTFFEQYDKVVNIVMRKYLDKPTKLYKFKGSTFATFATKEQCDAFLKLTVQFEEKPLETKWENDYYEAKKLERATEKQQKSKKSEDASTIVLPKGSVFHLDGLVAESTREIIKEAVTALDGEVAFIDYIKGDQAGHVRLTTENSAKPFVDKLEDSKLKVGAVHATARVIEGDEETEFLAKVVENMKSRRNQGNRFKGGRNNRYQNNRKRHGSSNDLSSAPKRSRAD